MIRPEKVKTMLKMLIVFSCLFASLKGGIVTRAGESERWFMNEEWYDWHPRARFKVTKEGMLSVEVHSVGPGIASPRGIYVRGDVDSPLEKIVLGAITDHRNKPLKTEPAVIRAKGTPEGKKWIRLGRSSFRRGYKSLTLKLQEGANFDYLCLSPNERYITINNNIDAPFYHPDLCFPAASIDGKARVLRDEGVLGLKSVEEISLDASYPIALLRFSDRDWPVDLLVRAWSPLIPGNLDDSSLPAAIFEFNLQNPTEREITAVVAFSWENLIGSGGRPQPIRIWDSTGHYLRFQEPRGNQTTHRSKSLRGTADYEIFFSSGLKTESDTEGNYTLRAKHQAREGISGFAYDTQNGTRLWKLALSKGSIPDDYEHPSSTSAEADAIVVRVTLLPDQKVVIPFVLTWHMDHFYQMGREDLGHYYANLFKDSKEVADYVLKNHERLFSETRALQDLFDRSDLPAWMTHMLLNDLYILSSDTWFTRDGRFSVNEGATNMYGVMGTMDQKLYASHHLSLLFPVLQMQELRQFGLLQNENGGIPHDLGTGQLVKKREAFDWPDLCSAFSILSYQSYRYTGDEVFWREIRPKVLMAIEALASTWDPDDTGVPGFGSTFDDEDKYRIFSYTTGLYLTVLKIGMEIAHEINDASLVETYMKRYNRVLTLAMKELWTGSYFRYGSSPAENKRTDASHFSQLAGEFLARTLGLEPNYNPEVSRTSLRNLFRLHWNKNFKLPPKIVLSSGMLFPRDSAHRSAPVSWPMHSRALMCGNAFFFGMPEEGWDLLKAMRENIMAANGPDPWDQSLYYDPITARLDWGVFYMTAPASWLAYQALIDTHYDAVTQTLTLNPAALAKLNPGKFPIITPKFWAMGEVSRDGRHVTLTVERLFAENAQIKTVCLAPDDVRLLDAPLPLEPGRRIEFHVRPFRQTRRRDGCRMW